MLTLVQGRVPSGGKAMRQRHACSRVAGAPVCHCRRAKTIQPTYVAGGSVTVPRESSQLLLAGHQCVAAHVAGRGQVCAGSASEVGAMATKLLDWSSGSGHVSNIQANAAASEHCS